MVKIETLLGEIKKLNFKELEIILWEVKKRIDLQKKVTLVLDDFIGIGQGIWEEDAQDYVDSIREDDRF